MQLQYPILYGETPKDEREFFFHKFRTGQINVLLVSKIGDEGIDLPDANVGI